MTTEEAKKQSAKRTRRSFLIGGVGAVAGFEFYRWIDRAPGDELLPRPLRKALNFNEHLSRGVFDERGLAPTYDVSQSVDLRINGNYGLKQDLLLDSYRLQVVGVENPKRFAQYVDDVTAWNYKYAAVEAAYTGHDTKEAPKPTPKPGGNAGSAKDMNAGAAAGDKTKQKPEARPDGGAAAFGPNASPQEGPAPAMSPAFRRPAFAAAKAANSDGRPERGQEESGESASTLDPNTPGLLLTMADVAKLPSRRTGDAVQVHRGLERDCALGGVQAGGLYRSVPACKE